jgi:hypothetical protein
VTDPSESAQQALEDLMPGKYKDEFVDRLLAEGAAMGRAEARAKAMAEGEAYVLLRVLAARGLKVPADVREQVLSCTDISQLDIWADRAATAASIEEVFGT